jgi:hypothetical protein
MLLRVDLVRTDVSEELSAFFIRVIRVGELGITLAVTSNRRTLRRKEVRMEFRIQDAEGSGRGGIVAWGCKWPEYKARSQASVEG